jgi:hypothetical protein
VKAVRWFSEPVLVIGSFLVTLGVIALLNGGSFRAAATLSGKGEPIAAQAESVPSRGALAGAPASTLAFVRRVTGDERPVLRRPTHEVSDARSPAARADRTEPALGIIFDDAWLLLIAGAGVICIGKGLRLVTEPVRPSLRSA